MIKKYYSLIFILLLISESKATTKDAIIENLKGTKNFEFNFEQNIRGKVEKGNCILQYPKKIYCKYDLRNQKILVSDGKSLVIKTLTSYYYYPLERTPLNHILNKDFLLKKIGNLNERIIDDKFINFNFFENENEINLFFHKDTYELIGWQTLDIYQNLSITYLSGIKKNLKINEKLFKLPKQN